jgi:hypothetical protein
MRRWLTVLFSTFLVWLGRSFDPSVILFPLNFIPFFGIVVSSFVKAINTSRTLHQPYFASKKMTPEQAEIFIEERKWDYRRTFSLIPSPDNRLFPFDSRRSLTRVERERERERKKRNELT